MGTSAASSMNLETRNYRKLRPDERRRADRYELDSAQGKLIYKGATIPCQFVDISMGGCCISTEKPFVDGALAEVEIVLLVFGMVLRIRGITQWVTARNLLGVRFIHPSARSKNQLASLLTCLIDTSAADVVKAAVASAVTDNATAPVLALENPRAGDLEAETQPQSSDTQAEPSPGRNDTPLVPSFRTLD